MSIDGQRSLSLFIAIDYWSRLAALWHYISTYIFTINCIRQYISKGFLPCLLLKQWTFVVSLVGSVPTSQGLLLPCLHFCTRLAEGNGTGNIMTSASCPKTCSTAGNAIAATTRHWNMQRYFWYLVSSARVYPPSNLPQWSHYALYTAWISALFQNTVAQEYSACDGGTMVFRM